MKCYTIKGSLSIFGRPTRPPEERKRQLAKIIGNPHSWFEVAESLIAAMRVLEPSIQHFWETHENPFDSDGMIKSLPTDECLPVHLMLAGLAIENLCKGDLASKLTPADRQSIADDPRIPASWNLSHGIRRMLEVANFKISSEERLVARIEENVKWMARYPAPIKWEQLIDRQFHHEDVENVNALIDRLKTHLGYTT